MPNSAPLAQDNVASNAERAIQKVVLPGQTPEGEHVLSVLVKRTYDIAGDGRCVRAERDGKLVPGDVPFGDPMNSSIKFESDFVPFKVATDVVFNCKVYAPAGIPVRSLVASVSVQEVRREVLVLGDRVCRYRPGAEPLFTDPAEFTEMDVRYERAYGGVDIYSDSKMPVAYIRNPLGRGFAITNSMKTIDKLALPNIEEPNDRLTPARLCVGHFMHWERQPMPCGLGWFPKTWQPRSSLAGVMPADRAVERQLRKAYRSAIPSDQLALYDQTQLPDMNFRFFNGASAGLAFPFLAGTETIGMSNLTSNGNLKFRLPGERLRIGMDIGSGMQTPEVVLQTVMVRVEDRQVDLVWRGAFPYPGPDWMPQMRKMDLLVQ